VSVVTKDTIDIPYYTKNADIIVAGAGVPGHLTPDMVKEGVVILDAGTSEDGGMLKGDAHPDCAQKAALITPVPGGIGPITIAVLLRNVTELVEQQYE
jgi:methylenetetrahydrofolate dehydrogenase (NADP+)/methenyltetrahydrofolate cyclohydrolase